MLGYIPRANTPLADTPLGRHPFADPPRKTSPPRQTSPPDRRLLQRTVCILPECILVTIMFTLNGIPPISKLAVFWTRTQPRNSIFNGIGQNPLTQRILFHFIYLNQVQRFHKSISSTVVDLGFFRSGCANSQKCYYFPIFSPKTVWKWKNLDPHGGVPGVPSGTDNVQIEYQKNKKDFQSKTNCSLSNMTQPTGREGRSGQVWTGPGALGGGGRVLM